MAVFISAGTRAEVFKALIRMAEAPRTETPHALQAARLLLHDDHTPDEIHERALAVLKRLAIEDGTDPELRLEAAQAILLRPTPKEAKVY